MTWRRNRPVGNSSLHLSGNKELFSFVLLCLWREREAVHLPTGCLHYTLVDISDKQINSPVEKKKVRKKMTEGKEEANYFCYGDDVCAARLISRGFVCQPFTCTSRGLTMTSRSTLVHVRMRSKVQHNSSSPNNCISARACTPTRALVIT